MKYLLIVFGSLFIVGCCGGNWDGPKAAYNETNQNVVEASLQSS
jgi:PBP1b-binding outer membrane lipoprotein LpoB